MDEQKFNKGFNSGYLLAEHTPDIINKLSATVEPANDYLNGIQSGAKQYNKEKFKSQAKDLNKTIPNKSKDHDKEMEKD